MQHRVLVVAILAACGRVDFDQIAADARADAAPIALACNTPVPIRLVSPTTTAQLAMVGGFGLLGIGWIASDGSLPGEVLQLQGGDAIIGEQTTLLDPVIPRSHIALAITAQTALVLAGASSGFDTVIRAYDPATLAQVGATVDTATTITSANAVAATGNPTARFALVGTTSSGSQIIGLDANGQPVIMLSNGAADLRQSIIDGGGALALVEQTTSNDCEIVPVTNSFSMTGTVTNFGPAGTCTDPIGAHVPGRTDVAVFNHDTADGDLDLGIATFASDAFSVGALIQIATTGDEPRAAGVSDGYWMSFATAGTLAVVHADLAASVADPPATVLGPLADETAHGIAAIGDDTYVAWIDAGMLWLARVCE